MPVLLSDVCTGAGVEPDTFMEQTGLGVQEARSREAGSEDAAKRSSTRGREPG
jgi:hypothetical protein